MISPYLQVVTPNPRLAYLVQVVSEILRNEHAEPRLVLEHVVHASLAHLGKTRPNNQYQAHDEVRFNKINTTTNTIPVKTFGWKENCKTLNLRKYCLATVLLQF